MFPEASTLPDLLSQLTPSEQKVAALTPPPEAPLPTHLLVGRDLGEKRGALGIPPVAARPVRGLGPSG